MFYWDEERIRLMEDAAAWGDFHARLAAELAKSLPPESRICDAGCGTGHLSLALSSYARQVTAVDVSQQALSLLADNCRKRNVTNIAIRRGDIHSLPPEQPYDAMALCFFGHMDAILSLAAAQCRATVLAVMRSDSCHRFSAGRPSMRCGGYTRGRETLRALGIPFQAREMELPMGQPFRSLADARRFFELYRRDGDDTPITDEFLHRRLTATGRADFPLYLPQNRRFGLLRRETREISKNRKGEER